MDLNKIHSSEQPLLKRTDVTYRVAYENVTPSRHQLVALISKKEKGTVVVAHVYAHAGETIATVHARVYADEATAKAVEQGKLLAKQKPEAPAAEEAPAAAEAQ
jgi:small subunit ribosomal protein S24e